MNRLLPGLSILLFFLPLGPLLAQINAPLTITEGAEDQYATVQLEPGQTVDWNVSGAQPVGPDNEALFVFNPPNSGTITLTATLAPSGQVYQQVIPIRPKGERLFEGYAAPSTTAATQHEILQVLRGERMFITTQGITPKPQLELYDFQGRHIATGDTIDYRAPVRGSYYVVKPATATDGTFLVRGIRAPAAGATNDDATPITNLPTADRGNLEATLVQESQFTGGESMITVGQRVVTAVFDFQERRTRIRAYDAGSSTPTWAYSSDEEVYIRSINADAQGRILAIGSSGGAGAANDQVVVLRLDEANGQPDINTSFGTPGYDYGFGIASLPDGSLVASGMTTGTFTGTAPQKLDAFARRILSDGTPGGSLMLSSVEDDRVFASKTLKNGNVLLFGDAQAQLTATTTHLAEFDIFFAEVAPSGSTSLSLVWAKEFGSVANDLAFDLVVDATSGSVYATGMTTGVLAPAVPGTPDPFAPQVYTLKLNPYTRTITWVRQTGPEEGQSGETLALNAHGVGTLFYTNGQFPGATNNSRGTRASDDMVVAQYDTSGALLWVQQFDQTLERIFARAIGFVGNQCYVLRDHVYDPGAPFATTSLDRFTLPLATANETAPLEKPEKAFQLFPNPASAAVEFSTDRPTDILSLEIYGPSGQRVYAVGPTRAHEIQVDIRGWQPGVYLVRATGEGWVANRRLLVRP